MSQYGGPPGPREARLRYPSGQSAQRHCSPGLVLKALGPSDTGQETGSATVSARPAPDFAASNPSPSANLGPTGRGAAWLARLSGGQEVPSSNLGAPTRERPCNPGLF